MAMNLDAISNVQKIIEAHLYSTGLTHLQTLSLLFFNSYSQNIRKEGSHSK